MKGQKLLQSGLGYFFFLLEYPFRKGGGEWVLVCRKGNSKS